MEHNHSNTSNIRLGNALKTGIAINIIFIIFEALFGFLSNSMALIADAGHNLSDVLALVFSWIAIILSQRKSTLRYTYGLRRSTILVSMLNTIILLVAVAFIVFETVDRLRNPVTVNAGNVIIVAAVGIVVNGFTAWLFLKDQKRDLNIRSAFVHFIADTLVSLGVVVTGIIVAFTGIEWLDPAVSFIIIGVILYSSYHLLIDSVNLALDAVPQHIDILGVKQYLESMSGVAGVHDLHVWALSTTETALTVHLKTMDRTDTSFIIAIQKQLEERFGIGHATIQVEYGELPDAGEKVCN
jgi:cobalt-zinc-cadmium efflux system protein